MESSWLRSSSWWTNSALVVIDAILLTSHYESLWSHRLNGILLTKLAQLSVLRIHNTKGFITGNFISVIQSSQHNFTEHLWASVSAGGYTPTGDLMSVASLLSRKIVLLQCDCPLAAYESIALAGFVEQGVEQLQKKHHLMCYLQAKSLFLHIRT